jgi:hypothetical protein
MDLAENILEYYKTRQQELDDDKQFHFATRMAAWRGDEQAFQTLRDMRTYIAGDGSAEQIGKILRDIFATPQTGRQNAFNLRAPYFQKYPNLYGAHAVLFRVRHLEAVYGIDARTQLFSIISEAKLTQLEHDLFDDEEAFAILSTYAVNYSYLLERVIRKNNEELNTARLFQIAKHYDSTSAQHTQLLLYLFTHCVIGESNFYTRIIPAQFLATYQEMLRQLEAIIGISYDTVNLDNKLEFLVCCRICNYDSELSAKIYDECSRSISLDGTFVVDTHNKNAQTERNSFDRSEHRNVLLIMSATPYTPRSTLVN